VDVNIVTIRNLYPFLYFILQNVFLKHSGTYLATGEEG